MATTFKVDPRRPVLRHLQDTHDYCGPACVQMIVGSLFGADSPPQKPIPGQRQIAEGFSTPTGSMYTPPDGFRGALNHFSPAGFQQWCVVRFDTEEELLASIAAALSVHRTPAAVTNGATDHWVVIEEITISDTIIDVAYWDPHPGAITGKAVAHTYHDACQNTVVAAGGNTITVKQPVSRGGTWGVFDTMLDRGSGKAVGVVFGCDAAEYLSLHQELLTRINQNRYEMQGYTNVQRR